MPVQINTKNRIFSEPLEVRRMLSVSFSRQDWPAIGYALSEVDLGDFNGDGRADLVVGGNGFSILIGNDSGGFSEPVELAAPSYVSSVNVDDFNGDGHADLAMGSFSDNTNTISIFTGDGSGGFSDPVHYESGRAWDTAVGDFNTDGRPDLAVISGNLSIYNSKSGGGFYDREIYPAGYDPQSLAAGDFNGDGRAELAVGGTYHLDGYSSVLIYIGNGESGFAQPVEFVTGYGRSSVAVGDFNADGRADLAVANPWWSEHGERDRVSILIGDGSGGFAPPVHYETGDEPVSVAIGDFNGDGHADLAVANIYSTDVSILIGDGNGGFSSPTSFATEEYPTSLTVGDFNNDGRPDLAAACFTGYVTILTNLPAGQWAINGSSGADTITVTRNGQTITANVNGVITTTQLWTISSISINAGDGNDTITIADDVIGVTIDAGAGNDRITGSDNPDVIRAGSGNDYIIANEGNDTVYGGDGKDTLTGSAGRDQLYGQNDADRISAGRGIDAIFGGSGEDRLYGNEGNDYIEGNGGVDRAWGGLGNDTLIGGGSNDKLYGEGGNDRFFGNAGADLISGGSGTDSATDEDDGNLYLSIESYF